MLRTFLIGAILSVFTLLLFKGWEMMHQEHRFPLEKIHIRGLVNITRKEAFQAIDTPKGTNLLAVNPDTIRSRLLSLPWVQTVRVKRVFPSTITITLTEKSAVCVGKKGEQLMLMDEYGMPIKPLESKDPLLLPVVTPAPGPNHAASVVWIMNLLDKQSWIKDQISEAVGQVGGRWVLHTKKGVKLLLSNRAEQELDLLHRLQKRYKILDLRIRQVELRIANRVAVRPEETPEPPVPEKNEHRRTPTT